VGKMHFSTRSSSKGMFKVKLRRKSVRDKPSSSDTGHPGP